MDYGGEEGEWVVGGFQILFAQAELANARVGPLNARVEVLSARVEVLSAQAECLSAQVELPSAQAGPLSEQIAPPNAQAALLICKHKPNTKSPLYSTKTIHIPTRLIICNTYG